MKDAMRNEFGAPAVVDRRTFEAEMDALRAREKAHTRESDAIAAARRRLPMVAIDGATPLIGKGGAVTLLDAFEGRRRVGMMHLVCYLRQGANVFETYWTTRRGVEAMDNGYRLLDLTVYGRQEKWEDSPTGWPQWWEGKQRMRTDGRPTSQWSRLKAGHSDDLGENR